MSTTDSPMDNEHWMRLVAHLLDEIKLRGTIINANDTIDEFNKREISRLNEIVAELEDKLDKLACAVADRIDVARDEVDRGLSYEEVLWDLVGALEVDLRRYCNRSTDGFEDEQ